jgi:hypothetical protein
LFFAMLLILSTDQFLTFIFGPVETTTLDSGDSAAGVAKFWNRYVAGDREKATKSKPRHRLPSALTRRLIIGGAAAMLLLGVASIGTAVEMMRGGYIVKFFQGTQPTAMQRSDLRDALGTWRMIEDSESDTGFETTIREAASDLGMRTDQWNYHSGTYRCAIALDQPFPGWHELTQCYQNMGWNLVENGRQLKQAFDRNGVEWPYIQIELNKPTGEKAFVLFSFFDATGQPFEAPADWGALNQFFIRLRNRLSPQVRQRLFNAESYQVQAFAQSARLLTDEEREAIRANYLELREDLREAFLQRRGGEEPASETAPATSTDVQ